jgi:hypothetical protein
MSDEARVELWRVGDVVLYWGVRVEWGRRANRSCQPGSNRAYC